MTTTNEQPKPEPKKLPYTKPELLSLGSVRELTTGGGNSLPEFPGVPRSGP